MLLEATKVASMQPCFASTASLPPRERFDYWHDVVSRNLVDLDYRLVGEAQFDASFHSTPINGLDLCRIKALPHVAQRCWSSTCPRVRTLLLRITCPETAPAMTAAPARDQTTSNRDRHQRAPDSKSPTVRELRKPMLDAFFLVP